MVPMALTATEQNLKKKKRKREGVRGSEDSGNKIIKKGNSK